MSVNNAVRHISELNGFAIESKSELPSADRLETAENLIDHYQLVFDHIRSNLSEKRNTKQERLVRQINERMEQAYTDPNFVSIRLRKNWICRRSMSVGYISNRPCQLSWTSSNNFVFARPVSQLEQTDWSVADVAEQTGFASSSYFHRMFKRSLGVTPTDFRRSKANAQ